MTLVTEVTAEVRRRLANIQASDARMVDTLPGGVYLGDVKPELARELLKQVRSGALVIPEGQYIALQQIAERVDDLRPEYKTALAARKESPVPQGLKFPARSPFWTPTPPRTLTAPAPEAEPVPTGEALNRLRLGGALQSATYRAAQTVMSVAAYWIAYWEHALAYYSALVEEIETAAAGKPELLTFVRRPANLALGKLSESQLKRYQESGKKSRRQWPPKSRADEQAAGDLLGREFRKFFESPLTVEAYTFDDVPGGAGWYRLEAEPESEPMPEPERSGLLMLGGPNGGVEPLEDALGALG